MYTPEIWFCHLLVKSFEMYGQILACETLSEEFTKLGDAISAPAWEALNRHQEAVHNAYEQINKELDAHDAASLQFKEEKTELPPADSLPNCGASR